MKTPRAQVLRARNVSLSIRTHPLGHVRNYSIGDVVARYKRMRGFNVLIHGLGRLRFAAENAAIERGVHPRYGRKKIFFNMKNQLHAWGLSYDWEREIANCEPEYYRWNQWIFLQFFKKKVWPIRGAPSSSWGPSCETVLAMNR